MKSRFCNLPIIQPDPLFETYKRFKLEENENKINLSIGMLQDSQGKLIEFKSVKLAEKEILSENLNKEYCDILGVPEFNENIKNLFFNKENIAYKEDRILVTQPVTGGASLRIIAEIIKKFLPKKIYLSNLTFSPYLNIFEGVEILYYPYYDKETKSFDFEKMKNFFENLEENSIICIQLSSHNPTALDPDKNQWDILGEIFKRKKFLIIFDAAYLGYATGSIEEDLYPVRKYAEKYIEMIISYSSAKNFTNYCDDIGGLFLVLNNKIVLEKIKYHIKNITKCLFSYPSLYGGRIINKILKSENLSEIWLKEQKDVFCRIEKIRKLTIEKMQIQDIKYNYNFLKNQKGIYLFLDLSEETVKILSEKYCIFVAAGGRVNLTGLNEKNVEYFVKCLKLIFEKK